MSKEDVYKEVIAQLEQDLQNRRVKNDTELDAIQTAALRGEITYIKNMIVHLKERVNRS